MVYGMTKENIPSALAKLIAICFYTLENQVVVDANLVSGCFSWLSQGALLMWDLLSSRFLTVRLRLRSITIVQCYAPTQASDKL